MTPLVASLCGALTRARLELVAQSLRGLSLEECQRLERELLGGEMELAFNRARVMRMRERG